MYTRQFDISKLMKRVERRPRPQFMVRGYHIFFKKIFARRGPEYCRVAPPRASTRMVWRCYYID